jgi:hypothetical protein
VATLFVANGGRTVPPDVCVCQLRICTWYVYACGYVCVCVHVCMCRCVCTCAYTTYVCLRAYTSSVGIRIGMRMRIGNTDVTDNDGAMELPQKPAPPRFAYMSWVRCSLLCFNASPAQAPCASLEYVRTIHVRAHTQSALVCACVPPCC